MSMAIFTKDGFGFAREVEQVDAKECDGETSKKGNSVRAVRGVEPLE